MESSVLIQKQIKDNSEDLQNYIRDLSLWETEMKRKDLELNSETSHNNLLPPVRRKKKKLDESVQTQKVVKEIKKLSGFDYASWDKLDVDKICDEIDNDSCEENSEEEIDEAIVRKEQALYEKAVGNRYVQDGKWDEAINAYSKAIDADSSNPVFYANRAMCYLKKQQWKEVEKDCDKSIALDSTYVKAYQRRAEARKILRKHKEAKTDLEIILKLEPKNNQAKIDLEKLEAKIKTSPQDTISDNGNGSRGENSEKDVVNKTIIRKEQALYEKALGNKYVQDGKWDEAINAYSKAIDADSSNAVFYANRAMCFLKKQQWKEVEEDCDKAIALDSIYVKAYQRRAEARKMLGKYKEAKTDLETILKLEPKNNQAKIDLAKVEAKIKTSPQINNKNLQEVTKLLTKYERREENIGDEDEELTWLTGIEIQPVKKPPHLRSKKPLKRVSINDVSSTQNIFVNQTMENINNTNVAEIESTVSDTELPPPPKTSVQFELCWKKIRSNRNLCHKYIKQLQGHNLPLIFKESLESKIFSDIISILASEFMEAGETVLEYLDGLSQVRRFSALVLFMSSVDRSNLVKLFDYCTNLGESSRENILNLKKLYEIKTN